MRRVLLDENLPRLLKRDLPGFDVRTVAEAGWAGTRNGKLLRLAEAEFDIFLTADRGLPHQQTVGVLALGVVVLAVGSTMLEDLRAVAPRIRKAIAVVRAGEIIQVTPA
ncbi:MAG TPA: DUF5615 family PIN-like protein [Longimicrobiaceae bacterium]|nr:DUF5615 family PIN-like protein [Longimicrobiaceae bacterium]